MIKNQSIDRGNPFDWGKISKDYAQFRDIYPEEFYQKILDRNIGLKGQKILDLGTGTGVLPRNLYANGAKWIGADISESQIEQARILSAGKDIEYIVTPTEEIEFPKETFDVVTACQCFWYFDHEVVNPKLYDILKKDGSLLLLYMAWLPKEDRIASASEELVLKYSPNWSGAGEFIRSIDIPEIYKENFELVYHDEYKLDVPFTRESWNGRIKACRGIGASLPDNEVKKWEKEHIELLKQIAPEKFNIRHYAAIAELKKK